MKIRKNKKKIATLIVAIIGATFAYFSASADSGEGTITGGTNDDLASTALSLEAVEMTWEDTSGSLTLVGNHGLVPTRFGEDDTKTASQLTTSDIQGALNAKCINNGYTGCHIWKITATSTQDLEDAEILLDLSVSAKTKDNWSYVLFTGSETGSNKSEELNITASGLVTGGAGTLATDVNDFDMHSSVNTVTASTPVVYYLMVYLKNIDSPQNDSNSNPETGTYTGTVTFQTAGGKAMATFTAAQ